MSPESFGSTTPHPEPPALRAAGLGFRYRSGGRWALRDCDFELPAGCVSALVGPNGAGKSTLFRLATDLLRPTEGTVTVFGSTPGTREARRRTAFLPQDKPLYPEYTVADTLDIGRALNTTWDGEAARQIVRAGDIPLRARVGSLSSGQRTRVSLALTLGKRPDLVLLDEPLADLDPLVREEVLGLLMAEAADREVTVLLSSHVLGDVEHSCDHVILLAGGRVRLSGDTDGLRTGHALITGRSGTDGPPPEKTGHVVHSRTTGRQFTALVRTGGAPCPPDSPDRVTEAPSLEDILLGHLRASATDNEAAGGGSRTEEGIA